MTAEVGDPTLSVLVARKSDIHILRNALDDYAEYCVEAAADYSNQGLPDEAAELRRQQSRASAMYDELTDQYREMSEQERIERRS